MANELLLPGGVVSMTAAAADRLTAAGNGDAAILYLWLLRAGGTLRSERACHDLKWDPARTQAALGALAGLGLAPAEADAPAPVQPSDEPPEYTAADLKRELEDGGSSFPGLVSEVQRRLGKVLSTADLKSLYTIYDYAALPAEVILLLVNWCVEEAGRKYGPGRMPRMPQIQREAFAWKGRGVDSAEGAEAYLKRKGEVLGRSAQILALLDIRDRKPVAQEEKYIEAWLDMGFPDETIRLAYERTVLKKQSLNWPYMNSILKSWHQKGLHTVEQVRAGDSARPRTGGNATRPQPSAPGEADRRAREDMDRMRAFLQKEKDGERGSP